MIELDAGSIHALELATASDSRSLNRAVKTATREWARSVQDAIKGPGFRATVSARRASPSAPDEAGGVWPVRTGKSGKRWKFRQRGGIAEFYNSVGYSPYARKPGQEVGEGVKEVQRLIESRLPDLAAQMDALIEDALK